MFFKTIPSAVVLVVALSYAVCGLRVADRGAHDNKFLAKLSENEHKQPWDCYGAYQDQAPPPPPPEDLRAYVEAFQNAYKSIHDSVVNANLLFSNWGVSLDPTSASTPENAAKIIANAASAKVYSADLAPNFLRFSPITPAIGNRPAEISYPAFCNAMGDKQRAARVSVSLKAKDSHRPSHLFQILKVLISNRDLLNRLIYSKIETDLRFIRTDAILLQLCYEQGKEADLTQLLDVLSKELKDAKDAKDSTNTNTLGSFITDEGPYLQKAAGVFSIADYTPGKKYGGSTSWGADVCCAYSLCGVKGLQKLLDEANKSPIPNLSQFVETYPCDNSIRAFPQEPCTDHCQLTPAGQALVQSTKAAEPLKFTARRLGRKSRRH